MTEPASASVQPSTHYSGILSAEAGTIPILTITIRLYCRPVPNSSKYIYTIEEVPNEFTELLDELSLSMRDIYIESTADFRYERAPYTLYIMYDGTLIETRLFTNEKYKIISQLLDSHCWEIQTQISGTFGRYFKIPFKNKYATEPHVSFYITQGTRGADKITYSVFNITCEHIILCASVNPRHFYMKDAAYTLHWQVVGFPLGL
jgi:hypothetical protein